MCQNQANHVSNTPSPCATVTHYPLETLKNTLNNNDDNEGLKKSSKKPLSEKQLNFARSLATQYRIFLKLILEKTKVVF